MGRYQAMTATAQAKQVIGTMHMIRILSALSWSEMMNLQAVPAGVMASGTAPALQGNGSGPALLPIFVVEKIGLPIPIVRQRANLFASMPKLTGARTKPDTSIVLFTNTQHPRLQRESSAAFFALQFNRRNPFRIGLAAILSRLEGAAVGFHWWKTRQPLRQFREGQAGTRTIFLTRQQARLDDHGPVAVLAEAFHAAVSHPASISHWGDWD